MKKTSEMESLTADIIVSEYESLYRMAYTYVHNESDAMDIVQESACKAITKCHTVKPQYVKTWLYRITINTAIDLIRKNKKEVIGIEDYEYGSEDSYRDFDTLDALNVLSPREKQVVILRFFEDLKLSEIAEILNENLNSVKSLLYRSLKKLKSELSEGESYHGK